MNLKAMMARHAAGPLARSDHFGELVTVHVPLSPDLDLLAVVHRLGPVPSPSGDVLVTVAQVFIPAGTIAALPNGTEVSCAMVFGGAVTRNRLLRVVESDDGGWLVEVAQ